MQNVLKFSKLLIVSTVCWGFFAIWFFLNDKIPQKISPFSTPIIEENTVIDPLNITKVSENPDENATLQKVEQPSQKPIIKPLIIKNKEQLSTNSETIWRNLTHGFQLDHKVDKAEVKREVRKLLAEQTKLYEILKAAGPYIYFILEQTKARGLPAEIALIPVIESEFNPNDHSNKGATGLWQIMRGTARELGIKVTTNYDGRRNVILSTNAALAYFNDLGKLFKGNWYLAIAAYNSGQVKVQKAIKRAGTESFWNLALPKETKYYIPKLLALAAIIKNPEKYGMSLPPINNKPYFIELKTKNSVNLDHVAKISQIPLATLKALNPDYKHSPSPSKNGTYSLLVPLDASSKVKILLASNLISH